MSVSSTQVPVVPLLATTTWPLFGPAELGPVFQEALHGLQNLAPPALGGSANVDARRVQARRQSPEVQIVDLFDARDRASRQKRQGKTVMEVLSFAASWRFVESVVRSLLMSFLRAAAARV